MSWVSPVSVLDTSGNWTNDNYVEDEDVNTCAYTQVNSGTWSSALVLFPPVDINISGTDYMLCNKVRFNAYRSVAYITKAKILLNILEGEGSIEKTWDTYGDHVWVEWGLEGIYHVELAVVQFYASHIHLALFYEFDFSKAAVRGKVGCSLASSILVNKGLA
jgi:hypothetical protein